jgi:tetratricopeptide (TPR) repeat protein/DNA-binding winged helix-turn-helix (wHTH) protein
VSFGIFEVDLRSGELCKPGSKMRLQDKPLQILTLLLEHPGEVVTREELQKRLWADDVIVDFEHSINTAVKRLREAVGDDAEHPRFIETLPRHGYRFIAPVHGGARQELPLPTPGPRAIHEWPPRRHWVVAVVGRKLWKVLVPVAVILVAAAIGGTFYFRSRQPTTRLTDKDTIVLSDFDNKTGDAVFDDTLKQGLSVQLEQSPFLALVSDRKVNETLKLMGRPAGDRLTPEVAHEVCERTGSKAMLTGSIAGLGSQYVVGLKAVSCNTGDVLAEAQEQAAGKEAVLKALDAAAVSLRGKLGESLSSVQKYATPVEEATTPSLEALKAFSLGQAERQKLALDRAIPHLERAIELDPNFAMAYATLGVVYRMQRRGQASDCLKKAFELKERASEREKLYISAHYYGDVTGQIDKTIEVYESWKEIYPRDAVPRENLVFYYALIGQHEKALTNGSEAMRLNPKDRIAYMNDADAYEMLDRYDEAKAIAEQAIAQNLDSMDVHMTLYDIAFIRGDAAGMQREIAWAAAKPGESGMLFEEGSAEYSLGKTQRARETFRRAASLMESEGLKEAAAEARAMQTIPEAALGNIQEAHQKATEALTSPVDRGTRMTLATALV